MARKYTPEEFDELVVAMQFAELTLDQEYTMLCELVEGYEELGSPNLQANSS